MNGNKLKLEWGGWQARTRDEDFTRGGGAGVSALSSETVKSRGGPKSEHVLHIKTTCFPAGIHSFVDPVVVSCI